MNGSEIGFCNGMGEMFELVDPSKVIDLLNDSYELGLNGFKLANGVGGYSNCPDTDLFVRAEYYYNFSLSTEWVFNPDLPPQTTIQKSFPLSKVNYLLNDFNFIDVSDVVGEAFYVNRIGLAQRGLMN